MQNQGPPQTFQRYHLPVPPSRREILIMNIGYERAMNAIEYVGEVLSKITNDSEITLILHGLQSLLVDETIAKAPPIVRETLLNVLLMKLMGKEVSSDNITAVAFYNHVKSKHKNIPRLIFATLEEKFSVSQKSGNREASESNCEESGSELFSMENDILMFRELTKINNYTQKVENQFGLSILDRKGNFLYMTKRAQELFGTPAIQSLTELNFFTLQPHASRQRIIRKFGPRIFGFEEDYSALKTVSFCSYSFRKINPAKSNKKIIKSCKKRDFEKDSGLFKRKFPELMRTACVSLVSKFVVQDFRFCESLFSVEQTSKNLILKNRRYFLENSKFVDSSAEMIDQEERSFVGESNKARTFDNDVVVMITRKSTRMGCPSYILNGDPEFHQTEYLKMMRE